MSKFKTNALDQIENFRFPYGKYKGMEFGEVESSYLLYWHNKNTVTLDNLALALQTKIREYIRAREELASELFTVKGQFVGKIGQKMKLFLKCTDTVRLRDTAYGKNYLNVSVDRKVNKFVYFGGIQWEKDKYYQVKAKIHDHRTHNNVNQTQIKNVRTIKCIEKSSESIAGDAADL